MENYDRKFFGHPRGLATLFMTEMWERFSYYGTRAILILFMVAPVTTGGLGFPDSKAGALYGLYTAMVYLLSLPGGWIADRILGQRKAVLYGGILIALGNYSLAVPGFTTFYLGLTLIVLGTGLLKPNISTMVGQLYTENDVRRDAGFSIFYMGINIGALLSPLVCGYLAQGVNWHYGFAAAAIGMTLGLVQYVLGGKYLGEAGLEPAVAGDTRKQRRIFYGAAGAFVAIVAILAGLSAANVIQLSVIGISNAAGVGLTIIVVVLFAWLLMGGSWSALERKRLIAIFVLFIASSLFWAAYEQAGSTLNLFADRNTRLSVWGHAFPSSWFQSMNSLYIMPLAPLFAWLWVKLGKRGPSSTAKFAIGLVFVGLGFAILIPVAGSKNVSPMWLTLTYLLHTIGELCLSPVGLSAMTKLAPVRVAGFIMGIWFLATSVGDYISGQLASIYSSFPLPELFGLVALFSIVPGLILFFLIKPMKRLMGGVN